MRKEMCEVKDRRTAKKRMPWASRIAKVEGGYMGFESINDFKIWNNQK